jgi:trans-2,3-dihydro-3-hydroxyanthranilate isomerase
VIQLPATPLPQNLLKYKFYQVDVFTGTPLGGNPLAVFVDAKGLDEGYMQKIAREMNLSETAFVAPSSDREADFEVRIFTPSKELPFAGHPVIGTAHVLREIGEVSSDQKIIHLKLLIGTIPVYVEEDELLFMGHPQAKFLQIVTSVDLVAESLGLPSSAIDLRWPCQIVSTGVPALFVPIKTLVSMQRIKINSAKLLEIFTPFGTDMIYVFTTETLDSCSTLHSRLFAPFIGVPEDPATGSASGAVGAYLAKHCVIEKDTLGSIKIEQGYEMKRPASIYVQVKQEGTTIKSIRVGGESVTIIQGQLQIEN